MSATPCSGIGRRILADIADRHDGITDADLARWCGVDRSLVGHWRSGERAMPVFALEKLLRRLPVPIAALEELAASAGLRLVPLASQPARDLAGAGCDLSESAADLQRSLRHAVADGKVDGDEARELQRRLDELAAQVDALRAAVPR